MTITHTTNSQSPDTSIANLVPEEGFGGFARKAFQMMSEIGMDRDRTVAFLNTMGDHYQSTGQIPKQQFDRIIETQRAIRDAIPDESVLESEQAKGLARVGEKVGGLKVAQARTLIGLGELLGLHNLPVVGALMSGATKVTAIEQELKGLGIEGGVFEFMGKALKSIDAKAKENGINLNSEGLGGLHNALAPLLPKVTAAVDRMSGMARHIPGGEEIIAQVHKVLDTTNKAAGGGPDSPHRRN